MEASVAQSVGVDISKQMLDVHIHPVGLSQRFSNDTKGLKLLRSWLRTYEVARIVYEPTGPYHHAFERHLGGAGLPLAKINPRRTRRFADAIGRHAKTDAIDAAMLAKFGAMLAPTIQPVVSETLDQLKELLVARTALVKDRVAAQNRSHRLRLPLLKRQAQQRLKQIEQQLTTLDAAMAELVETDPLLAQRRDILQSIPGIGTFTAIAILIEMPELGTIENKAAASLAGLAPIARDSGRKQGKRFIGGGRASLRQALYMPALVATRFNPDLKAKYQALVQAGKPAKLAITAVMRKLLILANVLLKNQRNWQPKIA